ncbi:MurR/RpiR family transcriptional regulator [Agromyces soli]|uniref:MurR/RpiR family transcriptional regulator n=1 Tax=Agromyces soli TaxID=659012 RepID=A0ABY4AY77_9MICO|nr:MurR/RpiR family transcriptional regulator [Agromyces soli]UOE27794.1 MurR/RpiR family transcriptional regulator [Agromyces soli]
MNDTHNPQFVTSDTRNPGVIELRSRVRDAWDGLSKAERAVSGLLAGSTAERILFATAAELGSETGTSNATVIRTLQKLGYAGLAEVKRQVAAPFTEEVAPEERVRQRLDRAGEDVGRIVGSVWNEASDQLELARHALEVEEVTAAASLLARAGRIYCYGVGASSVAAAHLVLRLGRAGRAATHLDADGFRLADGLLPLRAGDVAVIFAPGRVNPEVETIIGRCREVGAQCVLVTDELHERLAPKVAVSLHAPHTPTGLTAEVLASILVGDVLAQVVSAMSPELAVETSHALTVLRSRLGY